MKKNRFDLSNTVTVVAGAGGLLGSACAASFRDQGARVIHVDVKFGDRRPSDGEVHEFDVTVSERLSDFFRTLPRDRSKRWVFLNASYPRTPNWGTLGFENVGLDEWNRNVEMHLGSAFHFSQEAVKFMKEVGGGSLVNFGSIYGVHGPDLRIYAGTSIQNPAPYAAIKAGIEGITRYVATVFGESGIRANTLCPGGIENGQPKSFIDAYEARTPLRRMGTPEDIAGVAAFLASPAADYVTGQTLMVDGGWGTW